jgi:PPIC-type peptidyl-prolyl cis-trans isomerase-like protein
MRRSLIVVGLLAVAGCSQFSDLFTAHADVAARAGALELKTGRLAQILAGPKGAQLNRDASEYVGNLWTDYALFAQAVARHKLPDDSADVANVLWRDVADLRSEHWFNTLLAARSKVSPGAADSVYNANGVRVFQHMLFRVEPNAVPEERDAVRKRAEGVLAKVRSGADFGQLASQLSEDPGSAADSGFLPPKPRGSWVTAFDSAGWSLAPGAVSGIVETPYGYHIIKRPASPAVQPRINNWLREGAGTRLDSVYLDSLGILKKVKIASGGPAALRAALQDMDGNANSHKTVVTYQGGEMTVAEMLRWIHQIPPAYIPQIRMAGDSQLVQFIRQVANSALLLRQADSAKVALTPAEWTEMRKQYAAQIDSLRAEMGISGADVTDSTVPESERVKVAGLKLDQYFDALLSGKARLRPMPATLAVVLRSRMPHKLYEAGLTRGLDQARVLRAKSDSTNGGPTPKPGAMQPAPGPAPAPADPARTPGK